MKATMSKDGKMRITITIKRRIASSDLIDGIGWALARGGGMPHSPDNPAMAVEAHLKEFKSRKAILQASIESISHDGDSVWTWSDDCAWSKELHEQAAVLVFKKFPELR